MKPKAERDKVTKEIVEKWPKEKPLYKNLGAIVNKALKEEIFNLELFPSITYRTKELISFIKKALREANEYKNPYQEITDKLGVMIICHFKSELPQVKPVIEKLFEIVKFESKSAGLKYNQLGYTSDHYDVKIKKTYFKKHTEFENLVFEIQVRTICQNAWADLAHGLSYKQDNQTAETQRKIFRLTSLFEISDDEFDAVNQYLLSLPENRIYMIIRKLEGKFFKYAKCAYDKELSYEIISNLKGVYDNQEVWDEKVKEIETFITVNSERIETIFTQRQDELTRNIFLSQPEVFLIWYLLEKEKHKLINEWHKHYDIEDLNNLANCWGVPIE